ncbi:MAG: glycosyltransferase [Bacteroidales bacterium]|nr:glycosyltransferase [Bacteroidales bacterium]
MKISLLGTAYPFRGGLAAYNERLIKEFLNEGHEAKIETFTLQYPSFLFPGKTQMADWEAPTDIEIQQSVNSVNPLNWIKIGRKIKKDRPDILIIKYWLPFMAPCFGTIARIAKSNKHTKVIAILDNIIPHEPRIGDRQFSKYFVGAIDAFVAMSQSVLDDLTLFDRKKPIALNPHPLFDNFGSSVPKQEATQYLKLDSNKKYLLFFGLIRDYKGLDWLIEAFQKIQNKPELNLLIAGEFYSNPEPYLKQIEESGLKDKIILHQKFIPDPEVKYYFSVADLVVQPYKTATQSGVTQIAYHFEKPMVVTNVGGLAEIIPDGRVGFVVDTKPQAIAEAIDAFYDKNLQEPFHSSILAEKEKYSWSGMTKTILDLYHQL